MKRIKWWEDKVVYQIFPKSFADSNDDGIGDIQGIISKLTYLKKLGIDILYLCPMYKSGDLDNSFDVVNHIAIDPQFGTMEDMENLISKARELNIEIMLDLVCTHTSDKHPWFVEALKNDNSPKNDYYIWEEPIDEAIPPSNWRSFYGDLVWTYVPKKKKFYFHAYDEHEPSLNWNNESLLQEFKSIVKFWYEKGVRGFVINTIINIDHVLLHRELEPDYKDNLADFRHTTQFNNVMQKYNIIIKNLFEDYPDCVIGATGINNTCGPCNKWNKQEFAPDIYLDASTMQLGMPDNLVWHDKKSWKLLEVRRTMRELNKCTEDSTITPGIIFENDQHTRCIQKFFPEGTDELIAGKFIATLNLSLRGVPFIHAGQELGMTNVRWASIKMYEDIHSITQYKLGKSVDILEKDNMEAIWRHSRDNVRTPFAWDHESLGGFSHSRPWLPINNDFRRHNVEDEVEDNSSLLHFYEKMITLRKHYPALYKGNYEELISYSPGIYAFARTTDDKSQRIIVLANTTAKIRGYKIKELKGAKLLISNYPDKQSSLLRSFETRIYLVSDSNY